MKLKYNLLVPKIQRWNINGYDTFRFLQRNTPKDELGSYAEHDQ